MTQPKKQFDFMKVLITIAVVFGLGALVWEPLVHHFFVDRDANNNSLEHRRKNPDATKADGVFNKTDLIPDRSTQSR